MNAACVAGSASLTDDWSTREVPSGARAEWSDNEFPCYVVVSLASHAVPTASPPPAGTAAHPWPAARWGILARRLSGARPQRPSAGPRRLSAAVRAAVQVVVAGMGLLAPPPASLSRLIPAPPRAAAVRRSPASGNLARENPLASVPQLRTNGAPAAPQTTSGGPTARENRPGLLS